MPDNDTPSYPVSRQALYDMAWSEPMLRLAEKFNVSSSYLARIYTRLDVPRPPPGYWAKIAAGHVVKIPPLRPADPENAQGWDRYHPASAPIAANLLRTASPRKTRVRRRSPESAGPPMHPLIRGAEVHFLNSRDLKIGYLRPYKRQLVDLIVSRNGLSPALATANALFLALEDHGYRVAHPAIAHHYRRHEVDERQKPDDTDRYFRHWSPSRATLVSVGNVAIGVTLVETSESREARYENGRYVPVARHPHRRSRHAFDRPVHRDVPSGRFRLQAYSPYQGTSWRQHWDIPATASLARFGRQLANDLSEGARLVAREFAKAREDAEIRAREWETERRLLAIEQEARDRKEAAHRSHQELLRAIEQWHDVVKIETFFASAQRAVQDIASEDQAQLSGRIALAHAMIGTSNALAALQAWKTPDEHFAAIQSRSLRPGLRGLPEKS